MQSADVQAMLMENVQVILEFQLGLLAQFAHVLAILAMHQSCVFQKLHQPTGHV